MVNGSLKYTPASAAPFSSFSPAMAFQSFSALQGFTKVPQYIEDFLPLNPPPEHHSPFEPCFVTLPEFDFDIL